MKLAAVICVWSDVVELLPFCINTISPVVDEIIVVWSLRSNHGQADDSILQLMASKTFPKVNWRQCEPNGRVLSKSETRKRNYGIDEAYKMDCTHFIILDGDEMYKPEELLQDKERFKNPDLNGIVHRIKVFVGSPTLCCDDKSTLVPGIQKLVRSTEVGGFRHYPFAYDKKGNAQIDGTRRTNETKGVIMSDYFMWHMSYVRKNIDLKIDNSTAKLSNRADVIKRDIANAKPGYFSELYGQNLVEVENYFGIQI